MSVTIAQLEERLHRLGPALDAARPATDLADLVVARLERDPVVAQLSRRAAPRWLAAAAIIVAVVAGAALAIPGSRRAIARWFGFDSVRIERVPSLVPSLPSAVPPPTFPTFPSSLGLGPAITDEQARQATGLAVPRLAGRSDGSVSLGTYGTIIVAYPASDALPPTPVAGVGALLTAIPGKLDQGLLGKMAPPEVDVSPVQVTTADGRVVPAIWLGGAPHVVLFESTSGQVELDTLRLATNTLLWQVDDVLYRLESGLDRAGSMALAATVQTDG